MAKPLRLRPKPKLLSFVIPLFNEAEVFEELRKRLADFCETLDCGVEVVLVNDGSRDETQARVESWARKDTRIKGICFARNFGHQVAGSSGLEHAVCDAVAIMDARFQDTPQ